jgi:hypothetical protein
MEYRGLSTALRSGREDEVGCAPVERTDGGCAPVERTDGGCAPVERTDGGWVDGGRSGPWLAGAPSGRGRVFSPWDLRLGL